MEDNGVGEGLDQNHATVVNVDDPGDPGESGVPAGEVPPIDEGVTDDDDRQRRKDWVQKRINEITRKRREAEREAAYWKGVAEGKLGHQTKEDDDDEGLEDDLIPKEKVEKIVRETLKRERSREEEASRTAIITKEYTKARSVYPDFDEVALDPTIPITKEMFDAALGDRLGDILYALGKNPSEASRIASLSPTQQIKEIGKLEIKLSAKKTTNAPSPPRTVGGSGSPPEKPESEMTREELRAKWERNRRRRFGLE